MAIVRGIRVPVFRTAPGHLRAFLGYANYKFPFTMRLYWSGWRSRTKSVRALNYNTLVNLDPCLDQVTVRVEKTYEVSETSAVSCKFTIGEMLP